jgi:hypothetical protein
MCLGPPRERSRARPARRGAAQPSRRADGALAGVPPAQPAGCRARAAAVLSAPAPSTLGGAAASSAACAAAIWSAVRPQLRATPDGTARRRRRGCEAAHAAPPACPGARQALLRWCPRRACPRTAAAGGAARAAPRRAQHAGTEGARPGTTAMPRRRQLRRCVHARLGSAASVTERAAPSSRPRKPVQRPEMSAAGSRPEAAQQHYSTRWPVHWSLTSLPPQAA